MEPDNTLKVHISPILGDALAFLQPGEDLDEAILRALKARHPDQASALLPAATRIIELESQQAYEDKHQTVRRLAASDPGPEINLRTSGGPISHTSIQSTVIHAGGKEYHSLEELPPDLRQAVEMGFRRGDSSPRLRVGCSLVIIALLQGLLGK